MVTDFEHSTGPTPLSRRLAPGPAFPLSSPHQEEFTNFKPVDDATKLAPSDAFLSPNPFSSSSSDEDSGSSSGQDEFHLERYSQEAQRAAPPSRVNRKQSRRRKLQNGSQPGSDKKPRPGLNIVTTFSTEAKRSKSDGLVLDQVQSQRPQLGPRYATSIKSAKAEHMNHSFLEPLPGAGRKDRAPDEQGTASKRAIARQAVSKLQESQAARKRAAETSMTKTTMQSNRQDHPTTSEDSLQQPVSAASGNSPGARSIVIGMSVPEDEAHTHRSVDGAPNVYSAHTPDTPAIVITPADDSDSWKPPFFNRPRPPSSIYSAHPRVGLQVQHAITPPVPRIPANHALRNAQAAPVLGAVVTHSDDILHESHADYTDSDGDSIHQSLEEPLRASTDSQERILPVDTMDRRHKSQGWWNLMLSPMLSRKGTLTEKGNEKTPETPPVPSIPSDFRVSKAEIVSPLTAESPETPRRAGLASARASVWSRWTTWEKERDGHTRSTPAEGAHVEPEQPRDMVEASNQISPLPAIDFGKGLAAEYYTACAVEQLTRLPYFECENHSCAENLPRFQSIFDKSMPRGASEDAQNPRDLETSKAGDMAAVTQKEQSGYFDGGLSANGRPLLDRNVSALSELALSPNVRQADTATVVRARAIETPELHQASQKRQHETETLQPDAVPPSEVRPAPNNEISRRGPHYPIIAAGPSPNLQPQVLSPGPVSPAMQRTMTSEGAVPMFQIGHSLGPSPRLIEQSPGTSYHQQVLAPVPPQSLTIHNHTFYSGRSPFDDTAAVEEARREAMQRLESAPRGAREVEQQPKPSREEHFAATKDPEPAEKPKEKHSIWSKLKHLLPKKKGEDAVIDGAKKKKNRWWTLIIFLVLFLIVLACILLATLLTRTGTGTPVQSQWLNLTGYPPIPTGISTIARPDAVKQQSQCVAPNTMWSCALPKEDQFEVSPNSPDQPNFRFEITFQNGTVPANMTIPGMRTMRRRSLQERASDPFTNDLFAPNPSPPSRADQIFMGNTTDNVTQPFDGEQTPFFITFIPAFPTDPSNTTTAASTTSTLSKRQSSNSSDNAIPAPAVLEDGSAAPANLLPTSPFPTSQPLKLYNRGQADEHYGFYMYFDKAIFLESTSALNASALNADPNGGVVADDENGGSTRDQAQLRCTFSQTRFLVRMWTNVAFGATLLSPIADNSTNTTGPFNSATDFSRPGSFPYPTTISLDRHGGNINKKAVYCYGVDSLQVIQENVKGIVAEFRSVDGTLINPAPGLVNGTVTDDSGFDQEAGGIDGGTGGCECQWQNWS